MKLSLLSLLLVFATLCVVYTTAIGGGIVPQARPITVTVTSAPAPATAWQQSPPVFISQGIPCHYCTIDCRDVTLFKSCETYYVQYGCHINDYCITRQNATEREVQAGIAMCILKGKCKLLDSLLVVNTTNYDFLISQSTEGREVSLLERQVALAKKDLADAVFDNNSAVAALQKQTLQSYQAKVAQLETDYINSAGSDYLLKGKRIALRKLNVAPSFFILYMLAQEMKIDKAIWQQVTNRPINAAGQTSASNIFYADERKKRRMNIAQSLTNYCSSLTFYANATTFATEKLAESVWTIREFTGARRDLINLYFLKPICRLPTIFMATSVVEDLLDDDGNVKYDDLIDANLNTNINVTMEDGTFQLMTRFDAMHYTILSFARQYEAINSAPVPIAPPLPTSAPIVVPPAPVGRAATDPAAQQKYLQQVQAAANQKAAQEQAQAAAQAQVAAADAAAKVSKSATLLDKWQDSSSKICNRLICTYTCDEFAEDSVYANCDLSAMDFGTKYYRFKVKNVCSNSTTVNYGKFSSAENQFKGFCNPSTRPINQTAAFCYADAAKKVMDTYSLKFMVQTFKTPMSPSQALPEGAFIDADAPFKDLFWTSYANCLRISFPSNYVDISRASLNDENVAAGRSILRELVDNFDKRYLPNKFYTIIDADPKTGPLPKRIVNLPQGWSVTFDNNGNMRVTMVAVTVSQPTIVMIPMTAAPETAAPLVPQLLVPTPSEEEEDEDEEDE